MSVDVYFGSKADAVGQASASGCGLWPLLDPNSQKVESQPEAGALRLKSHRRAPTFQDLAKPTAE